MDIKIIVQTYHKAKRNQLITSRLRFFSVVRPGFEPGLTEPKSAVLPLHHRTFQLQIEVQK